MKQFPIVKDPCDARFCFSNGWVWLRTPDMRTSDSNLFQKPWHIRKSCKAESLLYRKEAQGEDRDAFFWQTLWQTFTPYSDRHVQNKIYLCFLSQWSFMFLANPFIESHYLFNLKFVGGNIKFIETSTSSIKDKLPQPLVVSISNTILFSLEWNKTFSFASSLIFVSCTVRDWLFEILVFTL